VAAFSKVITRPPGGCLGADSSRSEIGSIFEQGPSRGSQCQTYLPTLLVSSLGLASRPGGWRGDAVPVRDRLGGGDCAHPTPPGDLGPPPTEPGPRRPMTTGRPTARCHSATAHCPTSPERLTRVSIGLESAASEGFVTAKGRGDCGARGGADTGWGLGRCCAIGLMSFRLDQPAWGRQLLFRPRRLKANCYPSTHETGQGVRNWPQPDGNQESRERAEHARDTHLLVSTRP